MYDNFKFVVTIGLAVTAGIAIGRQKTTEKWLKALAETLEKIRKLIQDSNLD